MANHIIPVSLGADESVVATGVCRQSTHHRQFEQSVCLERLLHEVTDGVWCMVGNGRSNQTLVGGSDRLVAVDAGVSVEQVAGG